MTRRDGILFVVSAPSGAGKTTLCTAITDSLENLTHSISYTTRKPRPGEIDGRDYYFVSEERFKEMMTGRRLCRTRSGAFQSLRYVKTGAS